MGSDGSCVVSEEGSASERRFVSVMETFSPKKGVRAGKETGYPWEGKKIPAVEVKELQQMHLEFTYREMRVLARKIKSKRIHLGNVIDTGWAAC